MRRECMVCMHIREIHGTATTKAAQDSSDKICVLYKKSQVCKTHARPNNRCDVDLFGSWNTRICMHYACKHSKRSVHVVHAHKYTNTHAERKTEKYTFIKHPHRYSQYSESAAGKKSILFVKTEIFPTSIQQLCV